MVFLMWVFCIDLVLYGGDYCCCGDYFVYF